MATIKTTDNTKEFRTVLAATRAEKVPGATLWTPSNYHMRDRIYLNDPQEIGLDIDLGERARAYYIHEERGLLAPVTIVTENVSKSHHKLIVAAVLDKFHDARKASSYEKKEAEGTL